MAKFGFCGPSYSGPADSQECINWFLERVESGAGKSDWILRSTAGLSLDYSLNGTKVRGIKEFNGRTFAVAGITLYELYQDLTKTELGTVLDDGGMVSMAVGQGSGGPGYLLLASGGTLYTYNLATNTFSTIATFAGIRIGLVGYSDGYFIAVEQFSNRWFISALLDASTWDLLDVARISVFEGNIISMVIDHGEILFAGAQRGVAYVHTGAAAFPFEPNLSARIEQGSGAQHSAVRLDNSVFWLGANEHGHGIGWRLQGATPVRVTNHSIETALRSYSRIDDAVGFAYQEEGHAFWQLYFPSANNGKGATWVHDAATGMWHRRAFLEVDGTLSAHRSQCHTFAWGRHLVGDNKSANIYRMALPKYDGALWTYATDFDNPIRRVRRAPYVTSSSRRMYFDRLTLEADRGMGPIPALTDGAGNKRGPYFMLRWSNDGARTWSSELTRDAGQAGKYETEIYWNRLGSCKGPIGRVFELATSDAWGPTITDADLLASPGYGITDRTAAQVRKGA